MSKSKSRKAEPAVPAGTSAAIASADPTAVLAEKVKELVRLSKEQGQLTFDDVSEVLTEEYTAPANLDHVFAKLREDRKSVV